jgi:hypothetical protein
LERCDRHRHFLELVIANVGAVLIEVAQIVVEITMLAAVFWQRRATRDYFAEPIVALRATWEVHAVLISTGSAFRGLNVDAERIE